MDFSYRKTLGLNCSGVFYLWGYGEGRQMEILSGKGCMTLIMVGEIQTKFLSPTGMMVVVDNFFLCEWLWVMIFFLYLYVQFFIHP